MSVLSEVEETIKRINAHPGVEGCLVANHDGIAIRTTMENSLTVQYAALVHQLTSKAKSMVRDIEPTDDVTFIRIRTKRHELMIAPEAQYIMMVIQDPQTN